MTKGAGTDVRASAARHRTCTLGGADPAALARAYRARIGHVHCKDVREAKMRESNAGDWSFLNSILGQGKELGVYTVPGDGAICSTSSKAIQAGWSSKPSRIRKKPPPCRMRRKAWPTSAPR